MRTQVADAYACRWPGCPYEASSRVGTVAVRPFPVCVRHAAAWHASSWGELQDVARRLQPEKRWRIAPSHNPTDTPAYE